MRSFSYWEKKHFLHHRDHLIVGSGITGLTTAIYLKMKCPDASVLVLERGPLPTGASTRNAGFACFGSASEILDDLSRSSEAEVFGLIEKRFKGLAMLRGLVGDGALGYAHTGGYEVFQEHEAERYEECLGSLGYINAELVNAIGRQAFWDAEAEREAHGMLGFRQMIVNREEGMLDTGLMMKSLLKRATELGVDCLTGTEVHSYEETPDGVELHTTLGTLSCRTMLVATNGFARTLLPEVPVEPARAQVLITKPIHGLKLNGCFHHNQGYNYFRNVDGRVLLGGGRHMDIAGERTTQMETTEAIQDYLEGLLREYILPGIPVEIAHRWSGIMGVGPSKNVILKRLSPRVSCAVRLGGMGVALGAWIGKQAADLLSAD